MKTQAPASLRKRPVNLLLSEECVQQARHFTGNLSATVDLLLADYVRQQNEILQSRRQLGEAVAEAWNSFQSSHGSFADEHSTL